MVMTEMGPHVDRYGRDLLWWGDLMLRTFNSGCGSVNALVRARSHFAITGPGSGKAVPGAISVTGKILPEIMPEADDKEFEAMIDNIRTLARKTSKKDPDMPGILNFDDNSSAEDVVNVTATNRPLPLDRKQTMLMLTELKARAEMLMTALEQYEQMLDVRRDVMERARHGMEENQRNAFLQMQMDTIRDELYGDETSDADSFAARLTACVPEGDVRKTPSTE